MKVIKPIPAAWTRRLLVVVSARQIARFLGVAAVATGAALLGPSVPSAFAQPCPDVEVVFARGTYEPPGVGGVGQAFVDSLRSQAGGRSVGVYGVDYAASGDFPPPAICKQACSSSVPSSTGFRTREIMSSPWRRTARTPGWCSADTPKARPWRVSSPRLPYRRQVPAEYVQYVPKPMPPEVADHVAAVALFGMPSDQFLSAYGVPPIEDRPAVCAQDHRRCARPVTTICSGAPRWAARNRAHLCMA